MDKTDEFLEHFGVKGMKWGVRKDKGHEGQRAKLSKIARLDKKFERKGRSFDTAIKVHNRAARLTNENDISRINNKPQYRDQDFLKDTPLRRKYYKEHHDAFINNLEKAAKEFGTNASGTKRYAILDRGDEWDVVLKDVKHADDIEGSFRIVFDSMGHILEIVPIEDAMHAAVSEALAHFGVKGMKWGVRRNNPQGPSASADHIRSREIKKKAAFGQTKRLSNDELKTLIERMNLEQQFTNLKRQTPEGEAHKFVVDLLKDAGKQHVKKLVTKGSVKLVKMALGAR